MATYFDRILPGLQAMQNLKAQRMEMQDRERQNIDMQEASNALRDYYATGNQESLISATMKSPQLAQNVLTAMGLDDKKKQQQASADLAEMWQLKDDPQAFKAAGLKRIESIMQRGGNPNDTINLMMAYDKDPQQAIMTMKAAGAGLETQGFKTGIFDSTGEMTPYQAQSLLLREREINAQESQRRDAAEERKLKAMEAAEARLAAKEGNELKRQELQMKIEDQRAKVEQAKVDKQIEFESGAANIDNALRTLQDIRTTPEDTVRAASGPVDSVFFTLQPDVADFEEKVKKFESQAFLSQVPQLKGMGALSQAEGEKLAAALENMSLRQSPQALMQNVAEAEAILLGAKERLARRLNAKQPPQQQRETQQQVIEIGGYKVREIR